MTERYSEPHRDGLRDLYVTLDKLSEYVTGIDAWAVERVTQAVEVALQEAEEEEAERLVQLMELAVAEAET